MRRHLQLKRKQRQPNLKQKQLKAAASATAAKASQDAAKVSEDNAAEPLRPSLLKYLKISESKAKIMSATSATKAETAANQIWKQKQLKAATICDAAESLPRCGQKLKIMRRTSAAVAKASQDATKASEDNAKKPLQLKRKQRQPNLKQKQLKAACICDSDESLSRCGQSK